MSNRSCLRSRGQPNALLTSGPPQTLACCWTGPSHLSGVANTHQYPLPELTMGTGHMFLTREACGLTVLTRRHIHGPEQRGWRERQNISIMFSKNRVCVPSIPEHSIRSPAKELLLMQHGVFAQVQNQIQVCCMEVRGVYHYTLTKQEHLGRMKDDISKQMTRAGT